ncbi:MAG: YebG family protein [Halioglobus sp.]
MPVVAMWKCDRDDKMFENKRDADDYDKMLELAENFSLFLRREADGITELDAENIGLLLSRNKDLLVAACKGKPDLLLDIGGDEQAETSNITPLTAKA